MKVQVIQDSDGNETGVYIPIDEWLVIKKNYPNIEDSALDLPEWEKRIIDERLDLISKNPAKIKSDSGLLDELKR